MIVGLKKSSGLVKIIKCINGITIVENGMPIKNKKSPLTFEERHAFSFKNPVISWSSYSGFLYDKEQWYQTYVKGKKQQSAELTFGKAVADSMETDKPLAPFTRMSIVEYEFDTKLGKIPIVGSMDTFEPPKDFFNLRESSECTGGEFKTGVKPWDQKRVDEHGQLTFYTLCLWLQNKIPPHHVNWFLEWAPTVKTESGDFHHKIEFANVPIKRFTTRRTMTQVLELAANITKVHKEMFEYVKNHK